MKRGTIIVVNLAYLRHLDAFIKDYMYRGSQSLWKVRRIPHDGIYCCRESFSVSLINSFPNDRILLEGIYNSPGVLGDGRYAEPGYPEQYFSIIWEPSEEDIIKEEL